MPSDTFRAVLFRESSLTVLQRKVKVVSEPGGVPEVLHSSWALRWADLELRFGCLSFASAWKEFFSHQREMAARLVRGR